MTRRTLVFVHAHPDDEALLTAGTMARAAAEGHRVVLVVATGGEAGLAASSMGEQTGGLGQVRHEELLASARALGVARVEWLGYADSGLDGTATAPAGRTTFVATPLEAAAAAVAAVVEEERAQVLVGYDPTGGYGHPDHVRVHHVVRAAAALRPVHLFEATVDRDLLVRAARLAAGLHLAPAEFDPAALSGTFTPRAQITHRVDVRAYWRAKRAAMAAHASQASADDGDRTLAAFLRIPGPLFRLVFGTEWYCRVPV